LVEIEHKRAIDIGAILGGRYEIHSHIGQGGMSTVYKAKDSQTGNLVAVKVLFFERVLDARAVARFQQEVQAAAKLDHPCLAKVYDSGLADSGQPYLVMELVEGRTLAARIAEEGQLPIDETVKIFIQVCDGLAHAHKNKVLHRDLKPSNIMLTTGEDGSLSVKILDFGIAKMEESAGQSLHITQTGEVLGSPFYMSPEQARGSQVDQRSDLYSLGCALYETLTGGPPHIGQSAISTLLRREIDKPLAMSEASLGRHFPKQLEQIVVKLLKHDPNERYQSALEVKNALLEPMVYYEASNEQSKDEVKSQETLPKTTIPHSKSELLGLLVIFLAMVIVGSFCYSLSISKSQAPRPIPIEPAVNYETLKQPQMFMRALKLEGRAADVQKKQKYDEAVKLFKEAINDYVTTLGIDSVQEAAVWDELSTTYAFMHNDKEELGALNNAIRIYTKSSGNEERLPMLTGRVAAIYDRQYSRGDSGALDKAVKNYDRAGVLCQQLVPPKTWEAAVYFQHEGQDLSIGHEYIRAEVPLRTAANLFSKNRHWFDQMIDAQVWLSQCYRNGSKFKEARDCDQQLVDILKQHPRSPPVQLTNAIMGLAADLRYLSKHTDTALINSSISLSRDLLTICDRYPKHFEAKRVQALIQLGDNYRDLIDTKGEAAAKTATEYYKEVLSRCRLSPDSMQGSARVAYERLGKLESMQKHFEQARSYYTLAMKIPNPDRKSDAKLAIEDELHIARTFRDQGQFRIAGDLYTKQFYAAKKLYGLNSPKCAYILAAIGQTFRIQHKFKEARPCFSESVNIYNKLIAEKQIASDDANSKAAKDALAEIDSSLKKTNSSGR
jgi:serine/threonine protein kinase